MREYNTSSSLYIYLVYIVRISYRIVSYRIVSNHLVCAFTILLGVLMLGGLKQLHYLTDIRCGSFYAYYEIVFYYHTCLHGLQPVWICKSKFEYIFPFWWRLTLDNISTYALVVFQLKNMTCSLPVLVCDHARREGIFFSSFNFLTTELIRRIVFSCLMMHTYIILCTRVLARVCS